MIQIATYSNIGGRPENEDTVKYASNQAGQLCVVLADGLGGHGGGKIASSTTAETICNGWTEGADQDTLTALVERAHRAVQAQQTEECEMKSTVVALAIAGTQAAWVHVGDSRLYHFYNGRLDFQTRDHSASQVAVMLGEITPDQIRFHEDRSRVLKALGQEDDLVSEPGGRILEPGEHEFLMCSDGFWEYVLEDEMQEDLQEAADMRDWIRRMRTRLLARVPADNDNNSAVAVKVIIAE